MSVAQPVGRGLLRRLDGHLHEANDVVHDAIRQSGLAFDAVPASFRQTAIDTTYLLLDRQLGRAATGEVWLAEERAIIAEQAIDNARAGVPLRTLESCMRISVNASLRLYWSVVDESDTEDMLLLSGWIHHNFGVASAVASEAYCRQLVRQGARATAHRLLAERLVRGGDTGALARQSGINLPPAFVVLVLGNDAGAPLDVLGPDEALDLTDGGQRVVLLGASTGDAEGRARAERAAQQVMVHLAPTAPGLTAGQVWAATHADVPRARVEAGIVARLAVGTGLSPRLHTAADVLLESALLPAGPAADRLAAVLDALDHRPDLLRTLEAFYVHDFDRTRTAQTLFVNRRTLQQRLHRIHALTGHSPMTARGSLILNAALSAHRLRQGPQG